VEKANWLNIYSKVSVKSSLLKCPSVCFEICFLTYLALWAIFIQSLHLPLQSKPFPSPQSKILSTKQRDYMRQQTSKRHWSGSSRFIFPLHSKANTKGALHEIAVNSQSWLNLFSPIVPSLAILQWYIIT